MSLEVKVGPGTPVGSWPAISIWRVDLEGRTMHAVIEFKTRTTGFESYVALDQYVEQHRGALQSHSGFEDIIGSSTGLRGILDQIRTVAPTGSTVLIEGETGT